MDKRVSTEKIIRIEKVMSAILEGAGRARCLQNFAHWELSDRTIDQYISEARVELDRNFGKFTRFQLQGIISQLDAIFHKGFYGFPSYSNGVEFTKIDLMVARQALMDKAKLLGLIVDKAEIDINDQRDPEMLEKSTKELIKIVNRPKQLAAG